LGVAGGSVEALRADIRANLEREVKFRLLGRNKQAALDALVAQAELDLPKSIVQSELDRMTEGAREELKQRGIKDADKAPIPEDVFRPQAERRVPMWKSWRPATRSPRKSPVGTTVTTAAWLKSKPL
jgi:trigger factor